MPLLFFALPPPSPPQPDYRYSGQVQLLKKTLAKWSEDRQGQMPPETDPAGVEVASVDGFQGREKDLIVFSAVRANMSGQVGFLADWRRVNVMLTRAKYGVIIIGNSGTLRCESQTWAHWLRWAQTNKCIIGAGSSRFGEYDAPTVEVVRKMGKQRMQATLRGAEGTDSRSMERRIETSGGDIGEDRFDDSARKAARKPASPARKSGGDTDSWGLDTPSSPASNMALSGGGIEIDDWETDGAWDD